MVVFLFFMTNVRKLLKFLENDNFILSNFAYFCEGGSMLRMFLHVFTERSFQKGLNYFLINKYVAIECRIVDKIIKLIFKNQIV